MKKPVKVRRTWGSLKPITKAWAKANIKLGKRSSGGNYQPDGRAREMGRAAGHKVRMQQAAGNIGN